MLVLYIFANNTHIYCTQPLKHTPFSLLSPSYIHLFFLNSSYRHIYCTQPLKHTPLIYSAPSTHNFTPTQHLICTLLLFSAPHIYTFTPTQPLIYTPLLYSAHQLHTITAPSPSYITYPYSALIYISLLYTFPCACLTASSLLTFAPKAACSVCFSMCIITWMGGFINPLRDTFHQRHIPITFRPCSKQNITHRLSTHKSDMHIYLFSYRNPPTKTCHTFMRYVPPSCYINKWPWELWHVVTLVLRMSVKHYISKISSCGNWRDCVPLEVKFSVSQIEYPLGGQ